MKNYFLIMFLLAFSLTKAEQKIKIYYEQIEQGYNIYADNNEFCPMSIKIDFTVSNLKIEGGNNNIYVVDPLQNKQLLTTLKVSKNGKAYKFSYKYWSNYGNHNLINYDETYHYNLPYKISNTFKITQGYNGTFSHQNNNSLDFRMPVGTELMAVREGIVIKVVEKNDKNCGQEECKKYNNFIMIYHPDGTFAEYAHIKQNGSNVRAGDNVTKGQLIGYSGNVGYSRGPHLHLTVFKQSLNERETLKTKFKTGGGTKIEYLIEGEAYMRDY